VNYLKFKTRRPGQHSILANYEVDPVERKHVVTVRQRKRNSVCYLPPLHSQNVSFCRYQQSLTLMIQPRVLYLSPYFDIMNPRMFRNPIDLYRIALSHNIELVIKLVPKDLTHFGLNFKGIQLDHSQQIENNHTGISAFAVFAGDQLTAVAVEEESTSFDWKLGVKFELCKEDFVYFYLILKG
jgi:hypothetical protein